MAYNISRLKTDKQKELEGVWVPLNDGFRIKVARLGNHKYQDYLTKLTRPYQHQIRSKKLGSKERDRLIFKALARYVILDWENLEEEVDGKLVPVPCSREKAEQLLTDFEEFYVTVVDISADAELFRAEEVEESVKN